MPKTPDDLTARHLAKVIESSDDAIVSKDLNGNIISWNRAAERMFGYTAAEAVGQSIRMIIPDDRQAEEDEVLRRIRRSESMTHFETVRRRKDGTLIPISLTVSPIHGDDGSVIGASKIARDISDRVAMEAATALYVMNTEKLAAVGAVVASTLDREAVVQQVTDTATELTQAELGAFFHYLRGESGDSFTLTALSGASREVLSNFWRPRAMPIGPPTFSGDHVVRLGDVTKDSLHGGKHPYRDMPPGTLPVRSYLSVPVKGLSGNLLGGLFFGHSQPDMFDEQSERLAVGVASWASVALENSRLYSEAREANRVKDEFLAVLSHELRTPLNAIVGYSRLMRGQMLPPDQIGRAIETLERNARWLTQIVEDVLDVSRIVSGKIRLDVQTVEIAGVVDNAVATVQPAADAKGVTLQSLIDPRSGPIAGDPDRLQQVVWNLLSNAVKFTPRGGHVQARLDRVNSHVEITVSDSGIGISQEFLPLVFDRFRQADSGPTRKTGGLGLGLSIVRHLVEMHGGSVHAASAGPDQGATFTVRLPLMAVRPSPAVKREHPLARMDRPLQQLANLGGIRVLAVDDDADALGLLKDVLQAAGADVATATSAASALETIRAFRPQVVVADIGMPDVDGFELIRRIRSSKDPVVSDVPAAALTAFARSEDRTRALESGFEMHLSKPVDPGELVASVATLVRRYRPK